MMCVTPCSSCFFLIRDEEPRCFNSFPVVPNADYPAIVTTPGFCRCHRDEKWAVRNSFEKAWRQQAMTTVHREVDLVADLVILHDPASQTFDKVIDTYRAMRDVMSFNRQLGRLLVVSNGASDRGLGLLQHIQHQYREGIMVGKYEVVCPLERQPDESCLVAQVVSHVRAPYFIVLNAGTYMEDTDDLSRHLRNVASRCVFWPFSELRKNIVVARQHSLVGLHLTAGFKSIYRTAKDEKDRHQPYTEQLMIASDATGISLSWLMGECVVEPNT